VILGGSPPERGCKPPTARSAAVQSQPGDLRSHIDGRPDADATLEAIRSATVGLAAVSRSRTAKTSEFRRDAKADDLRINAKCDTPTRLDHASANAILPQEPLRWRAAIWSQRGTARGILFVEQEGRTWSPASGKSVIDHWPLSRHPTPMRSYGDRASDRWCRRPWWGQFPGQILNFYVGGRATSDSSCASGSTIHPSRRACCSRCASSGLLVLERAAARLVRAAITASRASSESAHRSA
jgi:hypothetical protein